MTIRQQLIALYTLVRRELIRMLRIASQVFIPPVITTALYFLIFGSIIGQRIGEVDNSSYASFIAPGLIMMSVITNSYGNVSSSLFALRFQKSIEELLVSPISNSLILLGYIIGGVLRGIIVALLVFAVACFFVNITPHNLALTLLIIVLVAVLFSLAGFTNAILARTFDEIMLIPTFILTPLTYLGGVFYSITMLPPFWHTISYFNPLMYMISALRNAILGINEVNMALALTIIIAMVICLTVINLILLKRGTGMRD